MSLALVATPSALAAVVVVKALMEVVWPFALVVGRMVVVRA